MPKILFCLRQRDVQWDNYTYSMSSGLQNSVKFLTEMLDLMGIEAKMVELPDNNAIDKEVKAYNPTHVIIEAFWVVPEKFDVLKKLHPFVTWIVRDHSETPFISMEGMTMDWIHGYFKRGVELSCNAPRALIDAKAIAKAYNHPNIVSYSPNYYPVHLTQTSNFLQPQSHHADDIVRVGCFGAIRPLKNHLVQAIAALRYADTIGKKLEFHINSTRIEGEASPILKNLIALFKNANRATLVQSSWLPHDKFLALLKTMDISLQVSFSETFNIVSADSISCGVPVIGSPEVAWLDENSKADPNSSTDILNKMLILHKSFKQARLRYQWDGLVEYCANSKAVWWNRFGLDSKSPF